jgi:hypothetical protein
MSYLNLKNYVGASDIDDAFVEDCWNEAIELVSAVVGSADVPSSVLNRAHLEAGSELFHRRSAPNGIAQFQTFDGAAIRVARDPLIGVYPILSRYLGWSIG